MTTKRKRKLPTKFELFNCALSVLAILIAYTTSQKQLAISAAEIEPHFHIEEHSVPNPDTGYKDEIVLEIYNDGAPVSNLSHSLESYLEVTYTIGKSYDKVILPITGYYFVALPSQTPTGKLITRVGHLNNANFHRLYKELLTPEVQKKYGNVEIGLKHIIHLTYLNRNDEKRETFFINKNEVSEEEIAVIQQASFIPKEGYSQVLKIDIEGLTVDKLMEAVKDYPSALNHRLSWWPF